MSAHADAAGLMDWIGAMPAPPKRVFVTHGEQSAALALRDKIENTLNWAATVPAPDEQVTL
jgi:metallo-beta-lactamase family protein